MMKKYVAVWLRLTGFSFSEVIAVRFAALLFLLGKTGRFLFFLLFLTHLVGSTKGLLGYSRDQAILFFLVFNVVDITSQLFFRGVYFFRQKVVDGELDFFLTKPMNPLFRILMGYPDLLDLATLIALLGYMIWFVPHSSFSISPVSFGVFLLLIAASLLITLAFHIIVVAIGIITVEVDHTIMIYRDITQMARFPIDIYTQPLRSILTFALPVAIMFTIPAKALMGLVSFPIVLLSLLLTAFFLLLSLRVWHYALSQYSSASS